MHHRPAPAPLPSGWPVPWTHGSTSPAALGHRSGRLALGALVSTVLTALILSVPVVSGAVGGAPFVALDSFAATSAATTTRHTSPVVMGRDGEPVRSSTYAGVTTSSDAPTPSSTDVSPVRRAPPPVTTDAAPQRRPPPSTGPRRDADPAGACPGSRGRPGARGADSRAGSRTRTRTRAGCRRRPRATPASRARCWRW